MLVFADAGFATALLQTVAASIAAGLVVSGFVLAGVRRISGDWIDWKANVLSDSFWGGILGMSCLLLDLAIEYLWRVG
jgi:hypothetical protein